MFQEGKKNRNFFNNRQVLFRDEASILVSLKKTDKRY